MTAKTQTPKKTAAEKRAEAAAEQAKADAAAKEAAEKAQADAAEQQAAENAKTSAVADAAEADQAGTDDQGLAPDQTPATGTDAQDSKPDQADADPLKDLQNAQAQADADAQQQGLNAAEAAAKALSGMSTNPNSSKGPDSTETEAKGVELTPLQLRVRNNGPRAMCHVTHAVIKANDETVITYSSIQDKELAKGNFAQINKLKGSKRFTVEG